ncbi:MAG: hypothetical protein ACK559_38270 [bacterium]
MLLSRVDRVEERDAHAGAAGTGVERSVALHNAGLQERRLLEDPLARVCEKFGAGDKTAEGRAAHVLERHG